MTHVILIFTSCFLQSSLEFRFYFVLWGHKLDHFVMWMTLSIITKYSEVCCCQSLSRVWLFVTPRTTTCQAPLSSTVSQSLLTFKSIESVMPSNHLILCHPFLLLPSNIFHTLIDFFVSFCCSFLRVGRWSLQILLVNFPFLIHFC